MNIGELFTRLSYGELSNLAISEEGSGSIAYEHQDKVISYLNAALTQIYARFAHKRHYVTFSASANRTSYRLVPGEPAILTPGFSTQIVKILNVKRLDDPATALVDETEVLGINVNNSTRSVKLTAFDTVVLQDPKDGEVYEVEFRGRHKKLLTPADPDEEIDISPALEEALEMNVASRVYSAMNGEANILKARELMAKYEEACQIVSAEDLLSETETDEHDRLRASGWV